MLSSSVQFLQAQSLESFFGLFWFLIIFELPRFVLGGVVGIGVLLFRKRPKMAWITGSQDFPGISVLIPTHNNHRGVLKTVRSLREMAIDKLQIIVVNDGSNDGTDSFCQQLLTQGLINDYMFVKARGGKASALNLGLSKVRYPFILGTDADTTFNRDALFKAMSYFHEQKTGAVCGNLRLRNTVNSLVTRFQQLNYISGITVSRMVKDMLGFYFVASGAFTIFRTKAISQVGGWNYGPGDDGDMSVQIRLSGYQIRFAPMAIATTDGPETFSALGRQRLRWFRSMVRVRYRKFRQSVLSSKNKTFNFFRALSFFETYFVQGMLPMVFLFYIARLIYHYGLFSLVIIIAVHLLYAMLYFLEFLLYLSISSDKRADLKLIPYIFFYSLFNIYFLRMVALYATANELVHRGSYTDPFYPEKVRRRVKKY